MEEVVDDLFAISKLCIREFPSRLYRARNVGGAADSEDVGTDFHSGGGANS